MIQRFDESRPSSHDDSSLSGCRFTRLKGPSFGIRICHEVFNLSENSSLELNTDGIDRIRRSDFTYELKQLSKRGISSAGIGLLFEALSSMALHDNAAAAITRSIRIMAETFPSDRSWESVSEQILAYSKHWKEFRNLSECWYNILSYRPTEEELRIMDRISEISQESEFPSDVYAALMLVEERMLDSDRQGRTIIAENNAEIIALAAKILPPLIAYDGNSRQPSFIFQERELLNAVPSTEIESFFKKAEVIVADVEKGAFDLAIRKLWQLAHQSAIIDAGLQSDPIQKEMAVTRVVSTLHGTPRFQSPPPHHLARDVNEGREIDSQTWNVITHGLNWYRNQRTIVDSLYRIPEVAPPLLARLAFAAGCDIKILNSGANLTEEVGCVIEGIEGESSNQIPDYLCKTKFLITPKFVSVVAPVHNATVIDGIQYAYLVFGEHVSLRDRSAALIPSKVILDLVADSLIPFEDYVGPIEGMESYNSAISIDDIERQCRKEGTPPIYIASPAVVLGGLCHGFAPTDAYFDSAFPYPGFLNSCVVKIDHWGHRLLGKQWINDTEQEASLREEVRTNLRTMHHHVFNCSRLYQDLMNCFMRSYDEWIRGPSGIPWLPVLRETVLWHQAFKNSCEVEAPEIRSTERGALQLSPRGAGVVINPITLSLRVGKETFQLPLSEGDIPYDALKLWAAKVVPFMEKNDNSFRVVFSPHNKKLSVARYNS